MTARYRRILVGFDGSTGAREALTAAVALAGEQSQLIVVSVAAHLPRYAATVGEVDDERNLEERACRRWLAEAEAAAADRDVPVKTHVLVGHAAQEITRAASDNGADLIVIGHSGHSGVWGRYLGGVAEKVSRHALCSVLIVRARHTGTAPAVP